MRRQKNKTYVVILSGSLRMTFLFKKPARKIYNSFIDRSFFL